MLTALPLASNNVPSAFIPPWTYVLTGFEIGAWTRDPAFKLLSEMDNVSGIGVGTTLNSISPTFHSMHPPGPQKREAKK